MQLDSFLNSFKMRFNPRIVTSVAAIALTCVVSAAAYYYRSRKCEINEVMIVCKLQFNVFNYFDKLLSYIEGAERSIHVCMPSVHNPAIQGRLVEVIQRKNIEARIIIDAKGYNESTSVFLAELSDAGAEIRMRVGEDKMHHKFCLIDDEILMTGTLDWGNDLSFDDWNYIYVTSKDQLVEPIKKEFDQMWSDERYTVFVPWDQTTELDNDVELNDEGTVIIKGEQNNHDHNKDAENDNNETDEGNIEAKNNVNNNNAPIKIEEENTMAKNIVGVGEFIQAEINFNNYQRQFNEINQIYSQTPKAVEVAK